MQTLAVNQHIQIRYIQGVTGGICHILGFDRGHLKMQENWFYTFFWASLLVCTGLSHYKQCFYSKLLILEH